MGLRRKRSKNADAAVDLDDTGSDVTLVPLDASGDDDDGDDIGDDDTSVPDDAAVPDERVLDELSRAFEPDAPERTTIAIGGDDELSRAFEPDAPERTTIAIGGDDDLPDAVYLDDELADVDGSAGTVFIDDDGAGDALAPKDATAPGMEPRLRQRRIGVRRAEGRRRLRWVLLVGGAVVVVVAVLAVLASSLFDIDDVDVTGARYVDEAVLMEVVDDLRGTATLLADTDDAERRLEADPWVESARVRTSFPGSATIEIRERVPLATMQGADERFRVLDREGRVLDVIDGQPVAFVRIYGSGGTDLAEGEFADVGYAAASSLVNKLTPAVRERLDSILAVPDGSDLRLVLRADPLDDTSARIEVRLGAAISDSDQIATLVRLERLLEDLDGTETAIDVSTDQATQL